MDVAVVIPPWMHYITFNPMDVADDYDGSYSSLLVSPSLHRHLISIRRDAITRCVSLHHLTCISNPAQRITGPSVVNPIRRLGERVVTAYLLVGVSASASSAAIMASAALLVAAASAHPARRYGKNSISEKNTPRSSR